MASIQVNVTATAPGLVNEHVLVYPVGDGRTIPIAVRVLGNFTDVLKLTPSAVALNAATGGTVRSVVTCACTTGEQIQKLICTEHPDFVFVSLYPPDADNRIRVAVTLNTGADTRGLPPLHRARIVLQGTVGEKTFTLELPVILRRT